MRTKLTISKTRGRLSERDKMIYFVNSIQTGERERGGGGNTRRYIQENN